MTAIGTETTVKTPYYRELTVETTISGIFLKTSNTTSGKYEQAYLSPDNAKELGTALLEAAGETIHTELGELPAVTLDTFDGYLESGTVSRHTDADPALILEQAKALLAIAKELQKRADAKSEAAKKAEAAKAEADAKLNKRRDELTRELTGNPDTTYEYTSMLSRAAIDKIIELEGKVSKPKVPWL